MMMAADFAIDGGEEGATLRLLGRYTLARIGGVHDRLIAETGEHGGIRRIDLSALERIDTVGAWVIGRLAESTGASIVGASPEATLLIEAVKRADQPVTIRPDGVHPFVRVLSELGESVRSSVGELAGLLTLFGGTIITAFALLRHPGRIRWNAVITRFETVGLHALGIVGLMSFLIGIVIAQQGATQLRQFGMEIFTINLVGRASIRELGLLMTAIMVAGRSGPLACRRWRRWCFRACSRRR
jgi:phospholipid/cholesterol/gamma-HCH transport system permease protein